MYKLKNLYVNAANPKYNSKEVDYEILLRAGSIVECCDEDDVANTSLPKCVYHFVSLINTEELKKDAYVGKFLNGE